MKVKQRQKSSPLPSPWEKQACVKPWTEPSWWWRPRGCTTTLRTWSPPPFAAVYGNAGEKRKFIHSHQFLKIFIYFYFWFKREGKEKEREETSMWERNIDWLPSVHAPSGHQTCNPGMCPDWESNQWPFSLLDEAQPTEPHQLGYSHQFLHFLILWVYP